ncbi:MAG: SRPBCC family protein [Chthoniobacterales bacterium]
MKWLLYLVALIALLVGGVFLVGYALPAQTTISRSITLKQSPEAVFAVLAEVKKMAEWNRNTEKVEMLPPVKGKEATRQTFKGGMTMIIITAESTAPTHLVRTLGDDGGPFAGSWTYDISPAEGGSRVVSTEVAKFENPLFRVMTRLFGQTKYMDEHLQDLAKKFGETVNPS